MRALRINPVRALRQGWGWGGSPPCLVPVSPGLAPGDTTLAPLVRLTRHDHADGWICAMPGGRCGRRLCSRRSAVLSIALGIGANAAIFTIVDQVLLRLLPVKDPARLVHVQGPSGKQPLRLQLRLEHVVVSDVRGLPRSQRGLRRHVLPLCRSRCRSRPPASPSGKRRGGGTERASRRNGLGHLLPGARRAPGAGPAVRRWKTIARPARRPTPC